MNIEETKTFDYLKTHELLVKNPIKNVFQYHFFDLVRIFGLICMGSTFYYFSFMYIPFLLKQELHYSFSSISQLETVCMIVMIVLVPIAGFVSDKVGRYTMLLFNALFIILITIPCFYLIHYSGSLLTILALTFLTLASSLEQGTTPAVLIENFPASTRYTGVSLGYNIGNGLLGGSLPLVCGWLANTTHLIIAPAFYIVFCAMITATFAFTLFLSKQNKIRLEKLTVENLIVP